MHNHFYFGEQRLLSFSPPKGPQSSPQQPAPQPESQEGLSTQSLETVKQELDVVGAQNAVQELIKNAEKESVQHNQALLGKLLAAAKLEYEAEKGAELADNVALDELNEEFAPVLRELGAQFIDDGAGLELIAAGPSTKGEALQQRLKQAMDKLKSGDMNSALTAVFELFSVLQEYLKAAKNGSLDDPFESQRTKQTRERQARRDKLRDELAGSGDVDALMGKKKAELAAKQGEVEQVENDIPTQESTVTDLKKQLSDEQAKPEDKRDQALIDTLTAGADKPGSIAAAEKVLQASQDRLATLKEEEAALQQSIADLESMQTDLEDMQKKLGSSLKAAAEVFQRNSKHEVQEIGKRLAIAKVIGTPDLKVQILVEGSPLHTAIREAMSTAGVAENALPTQEDMGLDSQGNLVSTEKFTNYLGTEVDKRVATQQKEAFTAAIEVAKETVNADTIVLLSKALAEAPGWYTEGDNDCAYSSGSVYIQNKTDPTAVTEYRVDGDTLTKIDHSDEYFDGSTVKGLPELDATKRGKLYTFEARTWRKKTVQEIVDAGAGINEKSREALQSPNAAEWPADGTHEYYYDGDQNLYAQDVHGHALFKLNVEKLATNQPEVYEELPGKYFNGTGEPKELPGNTKAERKRGYTFENHEWNPKPKIDVYKAAGLEKKAIEAVGTSGLVTKNGDVQYVFVDDVLYRQEVDTNKALDVKKFDYDSYLKTGDSANCWTADVDKYFDASGQTHDFPEAYGYYSVNEETGILDLDPEKVVNTKIAEGLRSGYMEIANAEGEWVEGCSDAPDYGGVRVGNLLYKQKIEDPDHVYVLDLETGDFKKEDDSYFDGVAKKIKDKPTFRKCGSYDQEKKTWNIIGKDQFESRERLRHEDGADFLNHMSGDLSAEQDTEYKWTVDLDGMDDLEVRYNSGEHIWEYSLEGANRWVPASMDAQHYDDVHHNINYWGKALERDVQGVIEELRKINERYTDGE